MALGTINKGEIKNGTNHLFSLPEIIFLPFNQIVWVF